MRKLLVLAAACVLVTGCGGGSKTSSSSKTDNHGCVPVERPITGNRPGHAPGALLNPKKIYDVVVKTNCGTFTIRLDQRESPNAAAGFASLADNQFYDETIFHRIVVGSIIQGGDPTGTGTGGPDFVSHDKVPKTAKYTHGVVAMAKTGSEPAGTGGSQFFIVTANNAGFTPDYAIFGHVIKGLDVVDRIGHLGDVDDMPREIVEIISATLKVSPGTG